MRRRRTMAARVFAAIMAATMILSSAPAGIFSTVTVYADQLDAQVKLGENLLQNGDFSEGSSYWGTNGGGISFENGKAEISVAENSLGADWMPGVFQEGFEIKAGSKYQISFDIISSIDRSITVGFDSPRAALQDIALTAGESRHVSYETGEIAVGENSTNQKLYFYLGMLHSETNYTDAHTIEIDNVSICEIMDDEDLKEEGGTGENGSTEEGGSTGEGGNAGESGNQEGNGPTLSDEKKPENLENGTVYTTKSDMKKTTTDDENNVNHWVLDWSDEFGTEEFTNGKLSAHNADGSGSALEAADWTYMIGNGSGYSGAGWGNNEKEYYTDQNTSVAVGDDIDGGALVIRAERESTYAGSTFTSTRLWTMDDGNLTKDKEKLYTKQYGRFESRIKIEPREGEDGTGLWPAFWLMPSDDVYGTWAASGEIDIMEARGSNQHSVDGTIHYGSQWPNNKAIGGHYGAEDPDFSTADWHTYAVEWVPGEIRWYVDDVCYYSTSEWYATSADNATDYTYPAPFNEEFYIMLNLAVGGDYDAGALSDSLTGANMYVDYVRVYDLADENGTAYTDEAYEAWEATVSAPAYVPADAPVSGEVGVSMVDASDLTGYKTTGNYPSEEKSVRDAQWFVSNLSTGTGTSVNTLEKDGEDDVLCINTTKVGGNDYEVQLIHNVPLTRGYRYELNFDGKADKAKSVSGKFANISGYPAYSDALTVDLDTDWQHYSYTLDMTADTDADARLEFTVGGAVGRTYFKNFSIVCTGKIPQEGADDAKEPLANGNHVYNGTFDQGTGRTFYWHAMEDTTLSSAKSECVAVVEGSKEGSGIYQKGMNLLSADQYRVSLDLSAQSEKNVTVRLERADKTTVYGEETFAVTEEPANYTFDFTMPEGLTDQEAVLTIVTGEGSVRIDNVSMKRLTNNNLDWSMIDFYPLYNNDFFNGDDGWNIWSENAGWQTHSINGAGAMDMEYSVGADADFWCVGVQSSAVKMTEGVPYKIVIHYESTKDVSIKVETPDGTQTDYDFAQGAHTKEISFVPLKNLSGKISMYFGNQPSGGNQHFIMSSMEVMVDEDATQIPEEYRVEKPGSIASQGAVAAGKDIVIKTNDAAWAEKITKVYVNGVAYDAADYVTVNGIQIILDASLMEKDGSYTVKFDAEGYAQTKAIGQSVLEANGNVIVNGKFTDNLDGWETYFSSWNIPNGTAEAVDGEAVLHIVSTEGNNWDCQLKQSGLKLDASQYYILSFEAYATVERPIQMEFANLGTASQTIVNLGTEKQTYYIYFTNVKETPAASILFMTGNVNGCLGDFAAVGAHDVRIDNVNLYRAEWSDIQAVIPPSVTLADQVILGNDIVLNYEENPVWEKQTLTVALEGKVIPEEYVSVDKEQNRIVIDGAAIGGVGSYQAKVTAEGYNAVSTTVNVIGDSNASILSDAWTTWVGDGDEGTLETKTADSIDFEFVKTIVSPWNGPEFWSVQAKKENISTIAGKSYVLSFDTNMVYKDSSVTAERGIVLETSFGQQTIMVPAGSSHYEIEYTPGARNDFYVMFMLGGAEADFSTKPHHISITNISLSEKSTGEIVKKETIAAPEKIDVSVEKEDAGKVILNWSGVDNAASYGIYFADKADGAYILQAETEETSYVLEGLEAGTYYVAVAAIPADRVKYAVSSLVTTEVTVEKTETDTPGEGETDNPEEGSTDNPGDGETDGPSEGSKPEDVEKPVNPGQPGAEDKPADIDSTDQNTGNAGQNTNTGSQSQEASGNKDTQKGNTESNSVSAVSVLENQVSSALTAAMISSPAVTGTTRTATESRYTEEEAEENGTESTEEIEGSVEEKEIQEEKTPKAAEEKAETLKENTVSPVLFGALAVTAVVCAAVAAGYQIFRKKRH